MTIGKKFTAIHLVGGNLPDVTPGKTYTIFGTDKDGHAYFHDDVGDRNFAMEPAVDGLLWEAGVRYIETFDAGKRRVQIRNARIVPAETIWPGRCSPGDMVLLGTLVSEHDGPNELLVGDQVRTSLIVIQDLASRLIETRNTLYEVVE